MQFHLFPEQDGHRIGFFARRTARHPDAHRLVRRTMGQQGRQHITLKRLKSLGVAKEVGHADQHVLKQQPGLVRMPAQKVAVSRQVQQAVDLEPALNAAQDGGTLVMPEIISGMVAHQRHDVAQRVFRKLFSLIAFLNCVAARWLAGLWQTDADGMGPEFEQALRHAFHRHNEVDHAGGNGGFGHGVVFGILRVLCQRQAAQFPDPDQAGSAVAATARQHDRHGPFLVNLGQCAKKVVDGQMRAPMPGKAGELQMPIAHFQIVRGRYDVHMVNFDGRELVHLQNRHAGDPLQYFSQIAFMLGRQMKNDDKGHAIASGHLLKKTQQRLQAACRSTDTNHRKVERAFAQVMGLFRVRGSVVWVCHADKPVWVNEISQYRQILT